MLISSLFRTVEDDRAAAAFAFGPFAREVMSVHGTGGHFFRRLVDELFVIIVLVVAEEVLYRRQTQTHFLLDFGLHLIFSGFREGGEGAAEASAAAASESVSVYIYCIPFHGEQNILTVAARQSGEIRLYIFGF